MAFSKLQIGLIVVVMLIIAFFSLSVTGNLPGAKKYDEFAKCLSAKGAVMYGAFWCPHCKAQKQEFGRSWVHMNYIECSTADGKEQTTICKEADIKSYPTWEFADGTRIAANLPLERLSIQTGCSLSP